MKKTLTLTLVLVMLASMLMAVPLAAAEPEKITLEIICPAWDVNPPKSEQWMWKEYEEMTGVQINWIEVPQSAMAEKKTTILASGELPDIFWQYFSFSPAEVYQYGAEGYFVALDEHAEWMPNTMAMLDSIAGGRAAVTMPDGHIYAFPYVMEDPTDASLRYYLNKQWLSNLNLEVPTSLEELEAVLIAFRDGDANGNGDSSDEYPIAMSQTSFGWTLERQLMGSFGLGDHGLGGVNNGIYLEEGSDQLSYIFTSEKMRELWRMCARWWQEGLFHPETFSGYDYTAWVSMGTNNQVGLFSWVGANYLYSTAPADYVGINALQGPYSKVLSWIESPVRGIYNGIVTTACENVEAAMKWLDFWYSEEGSRFGYIGKEGVTYVLDENGVPSYVDEILNYEGGRQLGAFQFGLNVYGGYYPYREPPKELQLQIQKATYEEITSASLEDLLAVKPKEIWPAWLANDEEQEVFDTYATDIDTAVGEYRVKFITGELSLETDWDAYVSTMNSIGVPQVLAARQAQFERYEASK